MEKLHRAPEEVRPDRVDLPERTGPDGATWEYLAAGLALSIPAVGAFALPPSADELGTLLWFLALVPVLLLGRAEGRRGAIAAGAVGLALMVGVEWAAWTAGRTTHDAALHMGVAITYVAISAGIAWISGTLLAERRAVEALAYTDPLTELPNRRHAQIFLDTEFGAAERGRSLAAVLFDLDHFKEYNDTHGHAAGDEALRAMAGILSTHSRQMNLCARYGGEEFLAVLSECDEEGAVGFAERIREALRDAPVDGRPLTVSAGVAVYDRTMHLPDDLVAAADRALYRAKRDGRDRVAVAGDPPA